MNTRKNPLLPVITILLLALIFLLATGRLMDVVEEVTFYWFDHTETGINHSEAGFGAVSSGQHSP